MASPHGSFYGAQAMDLSAAKDPAMVCQCLLLLYRGFFTSHHLHESHFVQSLETLVVFPVTCSGHSLAAITTQP